MKQQDNTDFSLEQSRRIGRQVAKQLHEMSRSERDRMYRNAYFNPKNAL